MSEKKKDLVYPCDVLDKNGKFHLKPMDAPYKVEPISDEQREYNKKYNPIANMIPTPQQPTTSTKYHSEGVALDEAIVTVFKAYVTGKWRPVIHPKDFLSLTDSLIATIKAAGWVKVTHKGRAKFKTAFIEDDTHMSRDEVVLERISESKIEQLVRPFADDYGAKYSASRYLRVAQAQLEADKQALIADLQKVKGSPHQPQRLPVKMEK